MDRQDNQTSHIETPDVLGNKEVYSAPKLTLLGKAEELTCSETPAEGCDASFGGPPGTGSGPCPS